MDVKFYEVFQEEEKSLRRAVSETGITADYTAATVQESGDTEPPAALVSIRTQSRLPASWQGRVQGLLTRSTGYDHLLPLLAQPGAPALAALPEYCTRAVAEQALLLWLALLRRLPAQWAQMPRFNREGLTGGECAGRTLAVTGVGRIGGEIARIGRALDMDVIGIDIAPRHPGIRFLPPAEAFPRADVVVCAMNLTAENRGYFDAARWQVLRPGAVFVNVARGELSPPAPLLAALNAGRLAGAALDVFDGEDALGVALRSGGPAAAPAPWPELLAHPRVLCTPHNAFNTLEAVARKSALTVRQCHAFLARGRFEWPLPALPPSPD